MQRQSPSPFLRPGLTLPPPPTPTKAGGPKQFGRELRPQRPASPPGQVLASKLQTQKSLLAEVEQNLQAAKQCSSSLASRFQEHCPDLERQEVEVHKLGQRSDNVRQQVELR